MSMRARGRHRKPSTNGRKVGLATVPLVAVIPLVGAPAASAATTSTWDRLARCESGGNWHINTGNGYYGGLQFNAGTWRAYGGGKFASLPHRATKSEQITVAERLLDARGWSPWPACSRRLGLDSADAKGSPSGSSSDRASRSSARTVKAKKKAKPVSTSRASGRAYTVRRGDTLSRIASRKHVAGGWHRLYRINKSTIGRNPGLIRPGQRLVLR
jgi:resuscitation-promoting factor RpfA